MNRREFETFLMRSLLNAQEHSSEELHWLGKTILPSVKVQFILRCKHCSKAEWLAVGSLQDIKKLEVPHGVCEAEFAAGRQLREEIYTQVSKKGSGIDGTYCSVFEYSIPDVALEVA